MSEYSRIPLTKSSPTLKGALTGSVRSYDSRVMELLSEVDDDDGGFRSMPEYALARIFSIPHGHDTDAVQYLDGNQIPRITMTPGSPDIPVRKKRRAPEPPSSLIAARTKFPSSDDIVDKKKVLREKEKENVKRRPVSFAPNKKNIALWDELLDRLYRSPSPQTSPRTHRTRNIIQKLRSPRMIRSPSRKRRELRDRLDEEAGFKPRTLSNSSSIDECDGLEVVIQFGIIPPDLDKEVEFEVQYALFVFLTLRPYQIN